MKVPAPESIVEQLAARQIVAAALSSALADPRSPLALRCEGGDMRTVEFAWSVIADETTLGNANKIGLGERHPRDVSTSPLVEWLSLAPARREEVHQRIFGLVIATLCPPYETEYCEWKDTTHRSQEMADISGFYRAFGVVPTRTAPERVDHISLEIEFIALLLEKSRAALLAFEDEQAEVCRDARAAFLRDHGAWWIPTFGRLLEKRANDLCEPNPGLARDLEKVAGVARVLCAWAGAERSFADAEPSRRIVSPSIVPQDADDDCGTCGSCLEKEVHASSPSNRSS